jgi:hypothetical protein
MTAYYLLPRDEALRTLAGASAGLNGLEAGPRAELSALAARIADCLVEVHSRVSIEAARQLYGAAHAACARCVELLEAAEVAPGSRAAFHALERLLAERLEATHSHDPRLCLRTLRVRTALS